MKKITTTKNKNLFRKYADYTETQLETAAFYGELDCITINAYDLNDIIKQCDADNIVAIVHKTDSNKIKVYALPETVVMNIDGYVPLYKPIKSMIEFWTTKNAGYVRKSVAGMVIDVNYYL